jgi:hypothetical protein
MPIFAGVAQDSSGVPAVFPVSLLYQNAGLSSDLPSKPTNLDLDL